MHSEWLGVELVYEAVAWHNLRVKPIHARRVDAVEVNRVWVGGSVDEIEAQAVAFSATEGGPGDLTVVGPGREVDTGGNFYLHIGGIHVPLAQSLTVGQLAYFAVVEVGEELHRVEARGINVAYCGLVVVGVPALLELACVRFAWARLLTLVALRLSLTQSRGR